MIKAAAISAPLSSVTPEVSTHVDDLKVAVVHEWLSTNAGSEKVTQSILNLVKHAKVFATVDFMDKTDQKKILGDKKPKTTFIQWLPLSRQHFRYYLPLFPFAIRTHRLRNFPVIISSSHAFAHGVKKSKDQVHISYCHTPMRYIWDMQELYLEANKLNSGILSFAGNLFSRFLRWWDVRVSKDVDYYISNSRFTAKRIENYYDKKAKVIYPPVDINKFDVESEKEDFYVTASRLVCYKKVEEVVEAFNNMPDKKLIVIGDGRRKEIIEKMAGPNVTVLSHLPFKTFKHYMRKAKAFVFAGEEDFGITLVEAQACGTPLIAFNRGGAAEIAVHGETGVLFDEQSPESIQKAVNEFEFVHEQHFNAHRIRANAERFSQERFDSEMTSFINTCVREKFGQ